MELMGRDPRPPEVRDEMPARFRGSACDLARRCRIAPNDFIFSEQGLSVHYFGRAMVDDDHESNYRFLFSISPDSPLLPLNREVVKVRFWRRDQFVFRKNDKPDSTETKNEANELKVQLPAVILVPIPAPNSQ